jgi:hypothetical protein
MSWMLPCGLLKLEINDTHTQGVRECVKREGLLGLEGKVQWGKERRHFWQMRELVLKKTLKAIDLMQKL